MHRRSAAVGGVQRGFHIQQRPDPLVLDIAFGGAQYGEHPDARFGVGHAQGTQQRQLLQVHVVAGTFGQRLHHIHAESHQLATLLEMQGRVVVGEQGQVGRERIQTQEKQQATGEALHESSLMK
ncbi:hypothetical protein D3C87_1502000 [compost metagenome]